MNVEITSSLKTARPLLQTDQKEALYQKLWKWMREVEKTPAEPTGELGSVPENDTRVKKSTDADLKVLSVLDVLLESLEKFPTQATQEIINIVQQARNAVESANTTKDLSNVVYSLTSNNTLSDIVSMYDSNFNEKAPNANPLVQNVSAAVYKALASLNQIFGGLETQNENEGVLEIQRHGKKTVAETLPDTERPQVTVPQNNNITGGDVSFEDPENAAGKNAQEVGTDFPTVPQEASQDRNIKYVDRAIQKLRGGFNDLVRVDGSTSAMNIQIKNLAELIRRLDIIQKRIKKGI